MVLNGACCILLIESMLQVWTDVYFSLRFLSPNGIIMMHDLNPRTEIRQIYPIQKETGHVWNGDSWRAAVAMRLLENVEIIVVDIDHGVGIARRIPNNHRLPLNWEMRLVGNPVKELSYAELAANRELLLRLKTVAEMREWLDEGDMYNKPFSARQLF